MKHAIISLLVLFFIAAPEATAQSPYAEHDPRIVPRAMLRNLEDQAAQQIKQRREAKYKEHQLLLKADRVVELWSALAHEYNEKGTFNMKTAKQVSKAFHDLEKSEGWPR